MEEIKLENNSGFFIQTQIELQDVLKNYSEDEASFQSYLKTMDDIDLWLTSRENNENN